MASNIPRYSAETSSTYVKDNYIKEQNRERHENTTISFKNGALDIKTNNPTVVSVLQALTPDDQSVGHAAPRTPDLGLSLFLANATGR